MSDLTNPLFDDEKAFLERKKLEFERALAADVENLKEQSLTAGKIAAVGAGAVAGVWLLSKLFGGSKKTKSAKTAGKNGKATKNGKPVDAGFDPSAEYYTDGMGVRHRAVGYQKSAAQSAAVFRQDERFNGFGGDDDTYSAARSTDQDHADDGGFGAGFGTENTNYSRYRSTTAPADHQDPDTIGAEVFANAYVAANTPYSLKLAAESAKKGAIQPILALAHPAAQPAAPAKKASAAPEADPFAEAPAPAASRQEAGKGGSGKQSPGKQNTEKRGGDQPAAASPRPNAAAPRPAAAPSLVGTALNKFLQSETGRVLLTQAGALALAAVTKQASKVFPKGADAAQAAPAATPAGASAAVTGKNADLAAASAAAPSETAARPSAPAASSDDSLTPPQPLA